MKSISKDAYLTKFSGTLPRVEKVKKTKKRGEAEKVLQSKCEKYLDLKGIRYIRLPDSLYGMIFNPYNKVPPQVRREISDCIKGVPDLIILDKQGNYNKCLLIELKTETGKLSQGQKSFSKGLNVEVVRDLTTFKELVQCWNLMGIKRDTGV